MLDEFQSRIHGAALVWKPLSLIRNVGDYTEGLPRTFLRKDGLSATENDTPSR